MRDFDCYYGRNISHSERKIKPVICFLSCCDYSIEYQVINSHTSSSSLDPREPDKSATSRYQIEIKIENLVGCVFGMVA